jgi:hypothetical protein
MLTFNGNSFTRGATGSYYIRVFAYNITSFPLIKDFDYGSYYIASDLIKVNLFSPIEYAVIKQMSEAPQTEMLNFDKSLLDLKPLKDFKDENSDEFFLVEMGKTYYLEVHIGSFSEGALANFEVPPLVQSFDEYPPLMQSIGGPSEYFHYKVMSKTTDEEGRIYVEFKIDYGGLGAYVCYLDFGTGISVPAALWTDNPISEIILESEPDYLDTPFDDPEREAYYTGRKFDHEARIRIKTAYGPQDNYLVIAVPINMTNNNFTSGVIPSTVNSLDSSKENYLAWVSIIQGLRVMKTNNRGEAKFPFLSVYDMSGEIGTCKFQFGVGDRHETKYLLTEPTSTNYTYIPSYNMEMMEQPSKHIAAYSKMSPPATVKVTSKIQRPFLLMTAQLNELFSSKVNDTVSTKITQKYMDSNI